MSTSAVLHPTRAEPSLFFASGHGGWVRVSRDPKVTAKPHELTREEPWFLLATRAMNETRRDAGQTPDPKLVQFDCLQALGAPVHSTIQYCIRYSSATGGAGASGRR